MTEAWSTLWQTSLTLTSCSWASVQCQCDVWSCYDVTPEYICCGNVPRNQQNTDWQHTEQFLNHKIIVHNNNGRYGDLLFTSWESGCINCVLFHLIVGKWIACCVILVATFHQILTFQSLDLAGNDQWWIMRDVSNVRVTSQLTVSRRQRPGHSLVIRHQTPVTCLYMLQ